MVGVKQIQVTFDCAEPERVARFWCQVLGYVVPPPPAAIFSCGWPPAACSGVQIGPGRDRR